ncbi:carboxypeptidase-like regulatory domain-containing protein [Chitinophagaceae bacterium MMS25-I14]
MVKSLISFVIVFICVVSIAEAQQYTAQLLDQADKQPIAYAVIGIPGSDIGTNSDESGNFTLTIGKEQEDKTLSVSLIGYEDYKIKVSEFITGLGSNDRKIYLKKAPHELKEVIIKPAKLTVAELGNEVDCDTSKSKGERIPMPYLFKKKSGKVTDTLTEIGTLMKVKHKKTFIDSVQINIGNCTYENIVYRLNIYEEQNGSFKNILEEPIYIKLSKREVGKLIKVNLTKKNLVVNNNFIVSIERVKNLGPGELTICGKIFGASMYMRVATRQDQFMKLPIVGMGIASFVTFSEEEK